MIIKKIEINTRYITLNQFLKLTGLINNGGEAKMWLANNSVLVNNESENRRNKKLYDQTIVEFDGVKYLICGSQEQE